MSVSYPPAISKIGIALRINPLLIGIASLLSAIPVALLVAAINGAFPDRPEKAVQVVALCFGVLLAAPCGVYLLAKRRSASPSLLALMALAIIGVLLVATFFYQVSSHLLLRGDFLIWTESDFVNDILKLRAGYPIYGDQVNNDSFVYMPGSQVLTYGLAWLTGSPLSIPVYRIIQLGYTFLATIVAFQCCVTLLKTKYPNFSTQSFLPWGIIWLPLLFLFATNSLTNPFVSNLNGDSLALLASVTAYYLLLKYQLTRNNRLLVLMAVFPALGFVAKQSVAIWAVLFFLYLALFDRPFSPKRLAIFALITTASFAVVWGTGYLLWGHNFVYWIFTVLGKHGVSILRSFQNGLQVWPYFAIGLLGGLVLLRGDRPGLMLGPWVLWLILMAVSAYTSGVAWMLNHMGPASLIAGIWFTVGLTHFWTHDLPQIAQGSPLQKWLPYGISAAVLLLLYSGLSLVRIPTPSEPPGELERYVSQIENEFEGEAAQDVLLDVGSWVYIPSGVIMKDRAATIGERGYSETGDFSGTLQRIEQQRYTKILVRNFNSPDFWYDHAIWRKSSGIRKALQDNYEEVKVIKGVEGTHNYLLKDISVLVPK